MQVPRRPTGEAQLATGAVPLLGQTHADARARVAVPVWLILTLAAGASIVVGFAMARSVPLGLAAVVAICYVPLALLNLQLAITLWLPSISLVALTSLSVGPNLAAMVILAAWVGTLAVPRSTAAALVAENARLLGAVGILVLWVLLSMAWAVDPDVGSDIFFAWIAGAAIMLVISTTVIQPRYLRLAAGAFVLGVVISVLLGLLGGAVDDESARLTGGSGDPNFLAARIAVPAIVLAAGLAAGGGLAVRVTVVPTVALLTIGLAATESRGGFIAAVVAAAAVVVLAKRHRVWAVAFLLCIVGVAGAWFSSDPAAWQRVSDFSENSGRTELWAAAWQMWQDHPFVGVGLEGFMDNASSYAREIGPLEFATFLTEDLRVVHNTYLQVLAETGIVGLLLFMGVIAGSLRHAWRAVRLFERTGDGAMAALSRSIIVALLATLASSAFVSAFTDRRLWVLIALGPALLVAAKAQARGEPTQR